MRERCYHIPRLILAAVIGSISAIVADSAINELVAGKLLEVQDEKEFIDSLRAKAITLVSPCTFIHDCVEQFRLVEIKVNDRVRNFRISSTHGYLVFNPAIKEFATWDRLADIFTLLCNHAEYIPTHNTYRGK